MECKFKKVFDDFLKYSNSITDSKTKNGLRMKTLLKSILLFLMIILIDSCAEETVEPETHGKISGLITNFESDSLLSDVNVYTTPATSLVRTDENGEYKISTIEPGEYIVTAAKQGYDTLNTGVTVVAGATAIADFILEKYDSTNYLNFGSISGQVLDSESGLPISNVNISTNPTSILILTNENGGFEIDNLTPGNYQISASKNLYESISVEILVTVGKVSTAQIQMTKTDTTVIPIYGSVSGKIIDAVSGNVIQNANIVTTPNNYSQLSDSEGNFTFNQLLAGSFTLTVSKNNYSTQQVDVEIVAGENSNVDFALVPTVGQIQGNVIDSSGVAIEDVIITTSPETGSFITNSEGNFEIQNIDVGSIEVTAEKIGYVSKSVTVTVQAGQTRTVVIMLAGE